MSLPRRCLVALFTALASLAFASAAHAAPVEWKVADGGNGHYYEFIYLGEDGNTWDFARAAAAARSHAGRTGHLATITSAAEQSFISAAVNISVSSYLGGVQARDSAAPDQGWSWITGEPWEFTFWSTSNSPIEPTDGIGFPSPEDNAENYLSVYPRFLQNNGWNDVSGLTVPSFAAGYVVEYAVPEPSSAVLSLMLGGVAVLGRTRGTRR